MKAISIRQPWAWLILVGDKRVENRTWRTSHRGPLLIHAAKIIDQDTFDEVIRVCREKGEPLTEGELAAMSQTGAVVGIVDVVDCTQSPRKSDRLFFNPGCWAFVLRNPQFIQPIPARGMPGLFDIRVDACDIHPI